MKFSSSSFFLILFRVINYQRGGVLLQVMYIENLIATRQKMIKTSLSKYFILDKRLKVFNIVILQIFLIDSTFAEETSRIVFNFDLKEKEC